MARSGRRSGGDRVLESRHLVGLFLGVVLLCAVFFTLGYVMGHTQYGGSVHAADSFLRPPAEEEPVRQPKVVAKDPLPASQPTGEWDFYNKKKPEDHLVPAADTDSASVRDDSDSPAPPENGDPEVPVRHVTPPPPVAAAAAKFTKGSIVLQVAAVTHSGDALNMAEVLQQKKFPAFVSAPSTDKLYRVQVGPYRNDKAAEQAKDQLGHLGFKAIIKR
jgi:DedD protein